MNVNNISPLQKSSLNQSVAANNNETNKKSDTPPSSEQHHQALTADEARTKANIDRAKVVEQSSTSAGPSKQSDLPHLPDQAWGKITQYLTPNERANMAQTNRAFAHAANVFANRAPNQSRGDYLSDLVDQGMPIEGALQRSGLTQKEAEGKWHFGARLVDAGARLDIAGQAIGIDLSETKTEQWKTQSQGQKASYFSGKGFIGREIGALMGEPNTNYEVEHASRGVIERIIEMSEEYGEEEVDNILASLSNGANETAYAGSDRAFNSYKREAQERGEIVKYVGTE
jgi:hypothetical protein